MQVQDHLRTWSVEPDRVVESETSWLVFGKQGNQRVVLKVARQQGDEWLAGSVIAAFQGRGMVRVLEWTGGATLLEEILPGTSLVDLTAAGRDPEAGAIFAALLMAMAPKPAPSHVPTAIHWGYGFERYARSGDRQIPPDLLAQAQEVYTSLATSQRAARLLHGDLHHENILLDSNRGWLAIDPKGVVAELEFELGAWLRNPIGHQELLTRPAVERRVQQLGSLLPIDPARTLGWAFAQGVLSAIWTVEDQGAIGPGHAGLALALTFASS
jgi:streptomycin 6-kinase